MLVSMRELTAMELPVISKPQFLDRPQVRQEAKQEDQLIHLMERLVPWCGCQRWSRP